MAKTTTSATEGETSLETGMLAFARSFQISEGLFYGILPPVEKDVEPRRIPIQVLEKGVRGQSSEDKAKNAGKSNPQTVEFAAVPPGCNQISLDFSIRVLPTAMKPHACGDRSVGLAYEGLAQAYKLAGGFRTLAELYVWNIANARFAWRNRFQTDRSSVTVQFEKRLIAFDPSLLSLETPDSVDRIAEAMTAGGREDLEAFIEGIAFGLANPGKSFFFLVRWVADMETGQEVFPSQEYVREEMKKEDVGRIYAKLPRMMNGKEIGQASMHSQKIGAAIRHVDVWHGDESHPFAISVNPYGGVQETGNVLRDAKSKKSLYDLRKNASALVSGIRDASSADAIPSSAHFVMANLIRGGVFGSSSKKKEDQ